MSKCILSGVAAMFGISWVVYRAQSRADAILAEEHADGISTRDAPSAPPSPADCV